MPSSSEQVEQVLEEVLRTIRQEYESPYPVLFETDRNRFVEEEESLRKQLKETVELESISGSLRGLLGLPSPQMQKCLKNAKELHQRVKDDIRTRVRTRVTGRGILLPPAPTTDAIAEDRAGPTSLLGVRCSISDVNVANPVVQNDHDYTADINEAINSQLETSSERSRDSPIPRRRRSPPPPPLRRIVPSIDSHFLSDMASNSGRDSPRRSSTVRRPPPPPPQSPRQSRIARSPTISSFSSAGTPPPDPAMTSSISSLAEQLHQLASSIVTQSLSSQAHGRQRLRRNDCVTKTNCVDINGSNVDGVTLNNGGTKNSGAVIHKTVVPPPRPPRHDPPL